MLGFKFTRTSSCITCYHQCTQICEIFHILLWFLRNISNICVGSYYICSMCAKIVRLFQSCLVHLHRTVIQPHLLPVKQLLGPQSCDGCAVKTENYTTTMNLNEFKSKSNFKLPFKSCNCRCARRNCVSATEVDMYNM